MARGGRSERFRSIAANLQRFRRKQRTRELLTTNSTEQARGAEIGLPQRNICRALQLTAFMLERPLYVHFVDKLAIIDNQKNIV
jgi:hypothetical protein